MTVFCGLPFDYRGVPAAAAIMDGPAVWLQAYCASDSRTHSTCVTVNQVVWREADTAGDGCVSVSTVARVIEGGFKSHQVLEPHTVRLTENVETHSGGGERGMAQDDQQGFGQTGGEALEKRDEREEKRARRATDVVAAAAAATAAAAAA
ncbi:hypothetical protein GGTG_02990 [Gaeumannomyces tritici R3-111a-1]|uniref:Uncharacterized protein n=1 Tax=Gaeumannomyces tritici (strain R3-111a-1) TaxID=644352 RepID=J3NNY4_GAET3|nr:hypothetical protein GGTG_02990 [Gaeumannomyces tritici R3-111a-1]EJT77887.1 hypothetical protein GGTG_02990 [Gaeumannomyces tritici R3-111a-1]